MSRESLILLLGVLVLLVPSLGIPAAWKLYVLSGCGVLLLVLGYALRRAAYYRRLDRGNGELQAESFAESRGPKQPTNPESAV